MARRSPQNERYGKYTMPAGKTRKSAAAAKPKRAVGDAPTPSKPGTSKGKGGPRAPLNPPTPEYKRLRRIYWGCVIAGGVVLASNWFLRPDPDEMPTISWVLLGVAYAAVGVAIYIDWTRMRPLRAEWMATGREAWEKEAAAKAKADAAAAKASAKKADGDTTASAPPQS